MWTGKYFQQMYYYSSPFSIPLKIPEDTALYQHTFGNRPCYFTYNCRKHLAICSLMLMAHSFMTDENSQYTANDISLSSVHT